MQKHSSNSFAIFLTVILALAIVSFIMIPKEVHAENSPTITLLPPAAPPGTPIRVSGTGFQPGVTVDLSWYGYVVDVPGIAGHVATYTIKSGITPDQNGNFTTTIISPSDFSDIPHQVNATQNGIGTGIINATFTTASTMQISPQPANYTDGQQVFLNITGGPLGAAALPITNASEAEVLKFTYDNVMWGFDTSHLTTEGPVATGGFIGWDVGGNISIRFTATGEVGVHTIRAYIGRETVPIWLSCEIGGEVKFTIMGPSLDTQTVLSQLSSLNAEIMSVQGDTAIIKTNLGNVTTSLSNIDAKIVSLQGNVATITTNVGTLSGTVSGINNGVATIQTDLGTLTVSDQGVKNSSDTTGNYALAVLAISIIGLIVLLAIAVQVFRKPK
ncbi:MAG TPA: hypothetical protein VMT42_01235 [candidate division Zixibacteria bacterium]|nr:hypothetical protein [candidate division Zixibacteria bacterium]